MGIVVFQQTPSYIKFKPFNENPFWGMYMDWQWRWPYGKWAQQIAHISVLCIANE